MYPRCRKGFFWLLFSVLFSQAANALVILQYHNIGTETPRSTSVTLDELKAHIQWLRDQQFRILPLDKALQAVRKDRYNEQDYLAAITFDDSHISVCDTAWPYLKAQNIPFTVFVNTDPVERGFKSQCTPQQLKEMANSGLVILGNHGKTHAHMTDTGSFADNQAWQAAMTDEILHAQQFLDTQFGPQPRLFAYPYGEYNARVQALLKQHSYIAFGQQSGAVGEYSDNLGLPRFPLSGNFAQLDSLPDKLNSLAFPAIAAPSSDNPITAASVHNPPTLVLKLQQPVSRKVSCFLANGTPVNVQQFKEQIIVQSDNALAKGRQRYNCTAPSGTKGRYYWFSHQWLIE